MKAKTKQILMGLIALGIVVACIFGWRMMSQDKGDKTITITIVVDNDTIYSEDVSTNSSTLADLLKELQEAKEIQLTYSNSTYGMYIQGMGTEELYLEDSAASKYWTYDSSNNAQCVKNKFCAAADQLTIADGDQFIFTLKPYED